MTNVVSLHSDNAQHYIKDFFIHLAEDKMNLPNFKVSAKSKIMSLIGVNKSLYEDVKNFYSSKKSNLFFLKDSQTNQYQGHFVVKFNKLEKNELSTYIKPQKFSNQDGFGVDENDGDGYLSLSKMSVKKDLHNDKDIFQKGYLGVFEKLSSLNVPQIVINSKNNQTFNMLCKFCDGKKLDSKDSINYLIPVDVDKIRKAFHEMELINIVSKKESIGEILGAIKVNLTQKQQEIQNDNEKVSLGNRNFSSAIERLNKFKEISRR